jgi:hypothetical protein
MSNAVREWSYVLLRRNEEGIIIENTDVTDEVVFLYRMIEKQEKLLNEYRLNAGYDFLVEQPSIH